MNVASNASRSLARLRQREQRFARDRVDLVDDQEFRMLDLVQPVENGVRLLVDPFPGVEQQTDEIGVVRAAPGRRHHRPVEPPPRRKDARRVDQDDLRLVFDDDAADQRARRLHLLRDDGHLGADQRVDQGRLADVRRADQRHEAAARASALDLNHRLTPGTPSRFKQRQMPPPFPPRAWCCPALRRTAMPGSSTATRNCGS